MSFEKSLFIFRRDLRLIDNLALYEACSKSKQVIPVFFFDPRQLRPHPYRSEPGMQFLFASLCELNEELKKLNCPLLFLHGNVEELLPQVINQLAVDAVFCSKDYTPFSRRRDEALSESCKSSNKDFFCLANILLNEPEAIRSGAGTPYTIYTPFAKACAIKGVSAPKQAFVQTVLTAYKIPTSLPILSVKEAEKRYLPRHNENLSQKGGRNEALQVLNRIENFANYHEERNFPALSATTQLSAHNKFGTISPREFFHVISSKFDSSHTLCKELYWRDFLTHIGYNFPHVFQGAFNRPYDRVEWEENDHFLDAWQQGLTGFPIVDAGMRELNATGFMHNRVRMIVASFLSKDLLLHWQHGERYFAQKLIDYDPAVNNGNWQWAASTGCDAQPYFRIFNPWLQGQKFDKEAIYIKRWVPELNELSPKQIHQLFKDGAKHQTSYPSPIVDHSEQRIRAQRLFEMTKA